MRSCNFLYFKQNKTVIGLSGVCVCVDMGVGDVGGGDKSTNCWQCLKKGLLEKTVKWWQENTLDQSQKKKKIEANQVCSSEKTPVAPVRDSDRNCLVFLSHIWTIVWAPGDRTRGHQSTQRKEPRHARLNNYVILWEAKPNQIIKTNLSFPFNWSSCLLKIALVY